MFKNFANAGDQAFVDPSQDHFCNFHGFLVGYTKAAHKFGFLSHLAYPFADGLSAAMNDNGLIPIIAMTANALEEDKEAALKNGMNAHIAKPLDMNIFMSVLKRFLK